MLNEFLRNLSSDFLTIKTCYLMTESCQFRLSRITADRRPLTCLTLSSKEFLSDGERSTTIHWLASGAVTASPFWLLVHYIPYLGRGIALVKDGMACHCRKQLLTARDTASKSWTGLPTVFRVHHAPSFNEKKEDLWMICPFTMSCFMCNTPNVA